MNKLVKKLAILMSTALFLQCGVVTTQAAAKINMVRENMVVAKDTVFTNIATAPAISIVFEDAVKDVSGSGYEEETFYVEVKGAEFTDKMFSQETIQQMGAVSLTKEDDGVMQVIIKPASNTKNYIIPLLVKMTGAEAEIRVRTYGGNTTVSDWGNFTDEENTTQNTTEQKTEQQPEKNNESNEDSKAMTMSFTLNSKTYTYNGEKMTMDAAPFIEAPGFMMVPVRYVAKVAGIEETDIAFDKGVITLNLKEGGKLILKAGSKAYELNGEKGVLDAAAVIKNGRTYIPVGAVARLLNVKTDWDSASKTAQFSRNA